MVLPECHNRPSYVPDSSEIFQILWFSTRFVYETKATEGRYNGKPFNIDTHDTKQNNEILNEQTKRF